MRLVYLALGWVTGILIASAGVNLPPWAWALAAVLMAGMAFWPGLRRAERWFLLALLAFMLGGLRYSFVPQTSALAAFNDTGGLTVEGRVSMEADPRDDRTYLRVSAQRVISGGFVFAPVGGELLVRLEGPVNVRRGDLVAVTGRLASPRDFDRFSYAAYLGRQGVFSVMDRASLSLLAPATKPHLLRWLAERRADLNAAIGRRLPEPQAGLLAGILLGDERGISPQLNDDFAATGAAHVIAISGFNMALLAGLVMGLLKRTPVSPRWQVALGFGVIILYTLFTGANLAVVRAAVMSLVLIGGEFLRRRSFLPASLAFVVILISVLHPNALWNISFQLSFFAVLGIAVFTPPVQRGLDAMLQRSLPPRWAMHSSHVLSEPLVVSIAASLTTLPLIVMYFERLSLVFLPVNLLIVPVQALLLLVGGAALLLVYVLGPVAQVLFWLAYVLLSWTIGIVRLFAEFDYADLALRLPSVLIYVYFALLIGWVIMQAIQTDWWLRVRDWLRQRVVLNTLVLSALGIVALQVMIFSQRADGLLHVWFLDVGHNNAVFIQTPDGAQVLVDGGRSPSRLLTAIGDRMPLQDQKLDVLVITQPDPMDTAALSAVLKRYELGLLISNGQPNLSAEYVELAGLLAPVQQIEARAGMQIELSDGLLLEVLHPAEKPELGSSLDSSALVLRLRYGEWSLLLTGDLSPAAQATLLDAGVWPQAQVLQLPQHGSARSLSPEFLKAVAPSLIVLQVDAANLLGDPDDEVLALLPAEVPLLRTDTGGTIHLWTDGHRLWSSSEEGS